MPKLGCCDSIYCFDTLACLRLAEQCAFEEPSVESISGENVLTWPEVVFPLLRAISKQNFHITYIWIIA
ncbi:BnaC01g32830D [Brassica napus]|uniref:BnaC01g32830D protein n=1 Tax=Brassica napus TaxID=3708 RepID=A0A078H7N8_BRANA|nr:BnaC01g32830D [Brassica napus]